ncbi:MAG: toxin-antitoxin system YwqK family antitoxin [Persicimonas sp.]
METFGHDIQSFPDDAEKVVDERHENGQPCRTEYYLDGEFLGNRHWSEDGELEAQSHFKGNKPHGPQYEFQDGHLSCITHYIDGLEHGIAIQYFADGSILGQYEMDHGTGTDLWYNDDTGLLAEERECRDGNVHGNARWWDDYEGGRVWKEEHYKHNRRHGIFRQWEDDELVDGFPKFFVDDEGVSRDEYLEAAREDVNLPRYRVAEDAPERPLLDSTVAMLEQLGG